MWFWTTFLSCFCVPLQELMAENASLRESLVMMQKELVAVLNEKSADLSLVLFAMDMGL